MIRPIERSSVHRICSGQVVLSLSCAIKELVENSLDAGATLIEVKTFDHGCELVEVSDNGSGVKASDFESLTLKHHTSKIHDFSDVASVETFGFRGEALSSLCAVSNLEIVTRHVDTDVGFTLTFDHNGDITSKIQTHRSVGTTVRIQNLFGPLCVRRKEFLRHARREFGRAVQLLSAYCLACRGTRFMLWNRSNGKKNVVLSTSGSLSYKDNICSLYGQKQVDSLMEINGQHISSEVAQEFSLPSVDNAFFKLEGFISSSVHGAGRSSPDRQFYFVNGRPCDMPKVSKVVNEVYRSFNRHQAPFVFLNVLVLEEGSADVNVTPDKRQIFVSNERVLLALVKSTLLGIYEKQPAQMTVPSKALWTLPPTGSPSLSDKESPLPLEPMIVEDSNSKASNFVSPTTTSEKSESLDEKNSSQDTKDRPNDLSTQLLKKRTSLLDNKATKDQPLNGLLSKIFMKQNSSLNVKISKDHPPDDLSAQLMKRASSLTSKDTEDSPPNGLSTQLLLKRSSSSDSKSDASLCCAAREEEEVVFDTKVERARRKSLSVEFSMDMLRVPLHLSDSSEEKCSYRKFRSRILPLENGKAEEELKKEIRKEDFSEMEVIGQFNLGFVVVRLREDLFIVDQHAADEKFHFELLQRQEQLQPQPLVHPQELRLSAESEAFLQEHLQLFLDQGFKLQLDSERPLGSRARLLACPQSRNFTFGQQDIEELIFLLADNPVRSVRPSRVNQMFASRACRMSVMVGSPLTKPLMNKLIQHMGETEQPWNCPHGRPTMRHLLNLKILKS